MVDEAKANEESDKAKADLINKRNEAEQLIHQTKKMMEENKDKLQGDEESDINAALEDVEKARNAEDATVESIDAAIQALSTKAQGFGKRVYEQAGAAEQAAGAGAGPQPGAAQAEAAPAGDDDIKDADFTVHDEKKD